MFERILHTLLLIEIFVLFLNGSRIIVPDENCPPTPKLTLSQTLTLTGGTIFLGGNCPDTFLYTTYDFYLKKFLSKP